MSLGKELASIRKSKNLTLEDIQNAVKIPLETLRGIENDSIFSDSSRNKTYVRSFVRSYAKYLKIEDEVIVKALDEIYAGTYTGTLYDDATEVQPDESNIEDETVGQASESSDNRPPNDQIPEKPDSKPVKPLPDQDDMEAINWADMGRKFTTASKKSKAWVVLIVLIVVGLIAGSGYYFWDDVNEFVRTTPKETEQTSNNTVDGEALIPAPIDSATTVYEESQNENDQTESNAINEQIQEPSTEPEPIDLGDRLTVVIYAAYGQLEPVRVTSDLNWRTNPFWMEQGEAYNFDFNDTLLVRGQYSRMLLLFNGHVIENPRQNYFAPSFNSIMITRSILNEERYLTPPEEFPLQVGPPDSIIYRLRY